MAGFLDALRAFFSPPPGVQPTMVDWSDGPAPLGRVVRGGMSERSLTWQQLWGSGADTSQANTAAGLRVDAETAMRSIVFLSGVRLLANDIGSLPVDAFRKSADGRERKELTKPSWMVRPMPNNPNVTWSDYVKQLVFSLLTDGNAFAYAFPSVTDVQMLRALNPADVQIHDDGTEVTYRVKGADRTLTPNEIIHIPWFLPPGKNRGVNPIEAAREGLGIALAADQFVGGYFGNGAVLSGWIKWPPGVEPTDDQVKRIKEDFARKHQGSRKSHAVGGLTGGAEFVSFDYNNRDAQLLELRDQIVEEVARLLGIPPSKLGSQKPGAVGYNSVEQRAIDYVTHGCLPITRRIEDGHARLLRGPLTFIRLNLKGLMAADQAARAQFYDSLLQNKVIRRDEVRALEDLEYDEAAVGYLETPNNNAPQEPAQEPAA